VGDHRPSTPIGGLVDGVGSKAVRRSLVWAGAARPARTATAVAVVVAFALPAALVVVGATRPPGTSVLSGTNWLRAPARLDALRIASAQIDLPTLLRNSLLVTLLAVPVTVLLASWAGTALALTGPQARRTLVAVAVLALVTPTSVLWVPRVVIARRLGLADRLPVLAAPALMATSATFVILLALATARLPRSLVDAARIEGMGPLRTWWRVVVPLTRGPLVTVAVLAFVARWADLVEPQLLLASPERRTLPLGLAVLRTDEVSQAPIALAAAVVATIPPVVVFALGARWLLGATHDRRGRP